MEEKQEFPKTFDKCPVCGSTRRLAGMIGEQEKAKHKLMANTPVFLNQLQTIVADQAIPSSTVPVLITSLDVCADCGTLYCIRADVGTATVQAKPSILGRQPPQKPPFFNNSSLS